MTTLVLMVVLVVIGICAWEYASGTKRRERALKRREEGDRVVKRILGK